MLGYRRVKKQNAHYRSKDPIGNLKIKCVQKLALNLFALAMIVISFFFRVTLKKLTAASVFNTGDKAESETGTRTKVSAKENFLDFRKNDALVFI